MAGFQRSVTLDLARRTGCHIALTHHETKRALSLDGQDGVLGSTALVGSVDVTFVLRREKNSARRLIRSTARYGQDVPETVLAMSDAGALSLEGTRREDDVQTLRREILGALEVAGTPLPHRGCEQSIWGLVEGRHEVVDEALLSLVDDGSVFRLGAGKRGDPFVYVKADLGGAEPSVSVPETAPPVSVPTPVNKNGDRNGPLQEADDERVTAPPPRFCPRPRTPRGSGPCFCPAVPETHRRRGCCALGDCAG